MEVLHMSYDQKNASCHQCRCKEGQVDGCHHIFHCTLDDPSCARYEKRSHEQCCPACGKGGEIRATKTLNLSRNIVSLQVLVEVWRFSPCLINLTRNKNICCRLKKCYVLIGWFVGHEQICCATSCEFDEKRAKKPKLVTQSRPALYFSQQLSSTRNKCFCCATSWSKSCNETMLHDKRRVFVSRILPP